MKQRLVDLFKIFVKIGLFTFGGGYAMISIIENECVEKKKWITYEDMMNITVIAESTPGPIAINCASFVGFKQAGPAGAFAATVGVVLPSFIIIYLISMFLDNFLEIEIVANAFQGVKIAVGVLIFNAAVNMIKKMEKSLFHVVIMVVSFIIMFFVNLFSWNFSSISLIIIVAVISLAGFLLPIFKMEGGTGK